MIYFLSHKSSGLSGDITVPGDKSISHRAIIFGAIAKGTTVIHGFLESEDCKATLSAFRSMGVTIEGPVRQKVIVYGVGKRGLSRPNAPIDCGNSGTSMRLLSGILAAQSFDSTLTGDASLLKRPMERVASPLRSMGAALNTNQGMPPLNIQGGRTLLGINYLLPIASAQVKSCLLLAGIYAEGRVVIHEPLPTRDHTERMMTAFSYPIKKSGNTVSLSGTNESVGTEIFVPGDISSAAFFMVAASIIPGSNIIIKNVGINPTRTGVISILKKMGANISIMNERFLGHEPVADLHIQYAKLKGICIPSQLVPLAIDEFPVLFIAAACAQGWTILEKAKELRCKESDRIATMVQGLQSLGIEAQALDDGVKIHGGQIQGGVIDSFGDHRVAMAFSIAGMVASAPVKITHCQNVSTSFPNFIDTAKNLKCLIESFTIGE